jgi:hypothetical protein
MTSGVTMKLDVSLTFHSDLRKLNTEPSIGASHQVSVGQAVSEKKIFRNQQECSFCPDSLAKMAATGNSCFRFVDF